MAKKKTEHYVNNKEFLEAIIEHRKTIVDAETADLPKPSVTPYISECYFKIATHLSYKPNFIKYPFREDMIMDGVENCIQYMHNFNPEKYKNPFAYFTQITYYAFLRRIDKEKKHLYTKYKVMEQTNIFELGAFDENSVAGVSHTPIKQSDHAKEYMYDFVDTFEKHKEKKNKSRVGVDRFIQDTFDREDEFPEETDD